MLALISRQPNTYPGRRLIWCAVLVSWGLALILAVTGNDQVLSHDRLLEHRSLPWPLALLLFVAAWQLMTGAMMLPTSLPMLGTFSRVSRGQARPRLALAAFLAAYFTDWTAFAFLALTFDAGVHRLVDHSSWLAAHAHLIAGAVLLLAGAFQFSPLKARCLTACRNPASFVWRFYQRGIGAAWQLGIRHGTFCLGCCWALMLLMFALGVGSLVWMAALTGVMLLEKTAPWGGRLVPVAGCALLLWGAIMILQPGALPGFLSLAASGT